MWAADPCRHVALFNASLEGNTKRAIYLHEGDEVDEKAFEALVRAAVALNASGKTKRWRIRDEKRHS